MASDEITQFIEITQASEEIARLCLDGRSLQRALDLFFEMPPTPAPPRRNNDQHSTSSTLSDSQLSSELSPSDSYLLSSSSQNIFPGRQLRLLEVLRELVLGPNESLNHHEEPRPYLPPDEPEIEIDDQAQSDKPLVLRLQEKPQKIIPTERNLVEYPSHLFSFKLPVLDLGTSNDN
jgi:hypothetical protein